MKKGLYPDFGKRSFDLALALVGLLVLSFPMLAIAAWVRLVNGSPILFRHERVGRKGVLFQIYKFRTMASRAFPDSPITVAGDPRTTRTGQWLRKFKLDELPQLLNVLKGEMSFVGPRPDVSGYMDRLEGDAAELLELRPGITGPATLAFRNEEMLLAKASDPKAFNDRIIFPEKVRLNLRYLRDFSFKGDLEYILQTILPLDRNKGDDAASATASILKTPEGIL